MPTHALDHRADVLFAKARHRRPGNLAAAATDAPPMGPNPQHGLRPHPNDGGLRPAHRATTCDCRPLAQGTPAHCRYGQDAGMVKRGLAAMFRNVSLLAAWDRKCRKFSGPIAPHPLEMRDAA